MTHGYWSPSSKTAADSCPSLWNSLRLSYHRVTFFRVNCWLVLNDQDRFCPESDRTQGLALFDLLELLIFPANWQGNKSWSKSIVAPDNIGPTDIVICITCKKKNNWLDLQTKKDINIAFLYSDRKAGSMELTAGGKRYGKNRKSKQFSDWEKGHQMDDCIIFLSFLSFFLSFFWEDNAWCYWSSFEILRLYHVYLHDWLQVGPGSMNALMTGTQTQVRAKLLLDCILYWNTDIALIVLCSIRIWRRKFEDPFIGLRCGQGQSMSVSAGSRYTAWIQAQVPFFFLLLLCIQYNQHR
jgi:hypothetical protein